VGSFSEVLFGIRGVTRILRLRRIVGKSVQCPRSRPVGSYFQFIQRQELESSLLVKIVILCSYLRTNSQSVAINSCDLSVQNLLKEKMVAEFYRAAAIVFSRKKPTKLIM